MKNLFIDTALQSGTGLLALQAIPPDIVPNIVPTVAVANSKQELIAIGASLLVSVLKWAVQKWIVPIFKKQEITPQF